MPDAPETETERAHEYDSSRPSKLRFKLKRKSSRHERDGEKSRSKRHRHRDHKRHRHSSPPPHRTASPVEENHASASHMDSGDAFRESLFDALADDEGAAYWESVYGQPVHIYSDTKVGPTGELERMSEEEYVAYVRSQMYMRTPEYIARERARREEARKRERARNQEETSRQEEAEYRAEEAAREARWKEEEFIQNEIWAKKQRQTVRWAEAWKRYDSKWARLQTHTSHTNEPSSLPQDKKQLEKIIPWPVLSGKREDVSKSEIKKFVDTHPDDTTLALFLKVERVRWHPDKMQQKLGGHGLDQSILQSITAIFQVFDDMWRGLPAPKSAA